ncbi:MAG: hypothetical protein NZ822_02670 [Patescibacteria group bacterium]|nr:hypothetical protein [Patescibacteria group bacterium]
MKVKSIFFLTLFLVLIGLLISAYLTYIHYSIDQYLCLNGDKCNLVLTSKYSKIFNIPLALVGLAYFSIFLFLLVLKINKRFLFLISLLSAGFAIYLLYLQFFVIKSICSYCIVIDFILLILPILLKTIYK